MTLFLKSWPRLALFLLILGLLSIRPAPAVAAEPEPYLFRLGLGCQGVFPEVGFSAVLNLTDRSGLQGLFIYNDYAVIWGGKYLHRFLLRPTHNIYAYGLGGYFAFYDEHFALVSTPGFIGGLGLEFTSGSFIANLKYNLEIGYSTAGVPWGPPGPGLVYGGGIHFYFF
ncbi:MAG TPA: hypothetical protein GXZ98_07205 [Firmicutes bacterium]|jgi:hypothetical protein|nr:hypothetical protein [Bacillota bacterium]